MNGSGGITWRYVAETRDGGIVTGQLHARSDSAATKVLGAQGLRPIRLVAGGARDFSELFRIKSTRLSTSNLAVFCEKIADLLNGGVPLPRALTLIAEQTGKRPVKALAARLAAAVRKGEPLSAALSSDPSAPPRRMVALVGAGEALGKLGEQFERLRASFAARSALQREFVSQLVYPAALFVLLLLTLIFLSFFVLPQFEAVFSSASATPPAETRFVLAAGAFIREHWGTVAIAALVVSTLAQSLFKRFPSESERLLLATPVAGNLISRVETARYCRTLGELLVGAMPLARAMPIATAAVSNSVLREYLSIIESTVRNGGSLSRAASEAPRLSRDAVAFIELGEETGELGRMLVKAAEHLEQQIAATLKRAAALAGPLITALMGALTAGVIAAVMTGVLSLNDAVY